MPVGLPLPRLAAVARAVRGRLAARRNARPDVGAVHREDPRACRGRADAAPSGSRRSRPTWACRCRCRSSASAGRSSRKMPQWFCWYSRSGLPAAKRTQCGSWPYSRSGLGWKSARTPWLSGCQSRAAVGGLEHAAARHADVHVRRIARIDQDRVQLRAVGRAVLVAAAPRLALRMRVEAGDAFQVAPPSSERNSPCGDVPAYQTPGCDAWPGRQPERVVDDAPAVRRRTPAASPPPSTSGRGRSSGTPSGRDARCAPRRAASCRRAGRAPRGGRCCPRNCGPASFQVRRAPSLVSVHRPLRVAISRRVALAGPRRACLPGASLRCAP